MHSTKRLTKPKEAALKTATRSKSRKPREVEGQSETIDPDRDYRRLDPGCNFGLIDVDEIIKEQKTIQFNY